MCVKFVKQELEIVYDMHKPLEEQLEGSQKVVVRYDPKDSSIGAFLHEMERLCKNGTCSRFDVEFDYNDNLKGFKAKNHLKQVRWGMEVNELIKAMVLMQSEADKKLEEIVNTCLFNRA